MSESYERLLQIDRESVVKEEGTFGSILATDGEASDGHIISIRGLRVPKRMPLLFGHRSEMMVPVLGSVVSPVKSEEGGTQILRVTNKVNLNGDDQLSDIRRGMFQLVSDGDIGAMSLRWSGIKTKPRTSLKATHPAYIDKESLAFEDPRRYGLYFEQSSALEGSLVAIGADPQALIGRSQSATNEHERIFFKSLAHSATNNEDNLGAVAQALTDVEEAVGRLQQFDCDASDIVNLLGDRLQTNDLQAYTYREGEDVKTIHLPRAAYEQLVGESLEMYRASLALYQNESSQPNIERELDEDPECEVELEPTERVVAAPGTVGAMTQDQLVSSIGSAVSSAMSDIAYTVFGKVK